MVIQKLKQHFINQNLRINQPTTLLEIIKFEQKYEVKLPQIFKEYFILFNGTGEANFGDEGYSFFSLTEFKPTKDLKGLENFPHANCFVFSEFLLWITAYAVKLDEYGNELGIYEICNTYNKVCNDFEEFILLIMNSDLATLDQ
ncbi:hypothetical protein ABIC56_000956 [Acinetobacter bereziniae]|uniref:SMI1/KNR4 family protein n=2 Tax=Acinetobacter bereziniae TaxID=106648 RepID=UPI00148F06F4|nr:SMI1/KNR4 family protein [Acinetobacter bereziniae]MDR6540412.1 hypothetical protein [Acinetobacter bereziniae]